MPAMTVAVLAGAAVGLGLTLLLRAVLPSEPQLAAALDRLAPPRATPAPDPDPAVDGVSGRGARLELWLGWRVQPHLVGSRLGRVPARDLALLRLPAARFLGQKVLLALLGLAFPPLFTLVVGLAGLGLPPLLPAAGSLLLAATLFMVPDLDVRRRAAEAREEVARAVTTYLDLTALERSAGAGATQALEQAAQVADSWVFIRLRDELARARWTGTPPWDRLHTLAGELGLPELADVADIMRLSGEQGAAVADTLRARSRGLRAALLSREQTRANEDSERLVIPVALLGLVFLALLGAPALLRIL